MTALRITPPAPVQTALDRLTAAGYSAYIVGGCVRDALRGSVPFCCTAQPVGRASL